MKSELFLLGQIPSLSHSANMRPSLMTPGARPFVCSSCARSLRTRRRRYATAQAPEIYDVVCVGGGPAGLGLLTALSTPMHNIHQCHRADTVRGKSSHLISQASAHRIPRPRTCFIMVTARRQLLQSRQLPYALFQAVPRVDRSMERA